MLSKLFSWYFTKRALPFWCLLALDCVIVMFSGYVGAYLQEGGLNFTHYFWPFTGWIMMAAVVYAIFFRVFHTYTCIVRYSSYQDLRRVLYANLCATLVVAVVYYLLPIEIVATEEHPYVLRLFGSMFGLSTLMMWVGRIVAKSLLESIHTGTTLPVAIYGTKADGISLANSINDTQAGGVSLDDNTPEDKGMAYVQKCFISDDVEMKDVYLMGKKVYLNGEGIAKKLTEQGVKVLIVSPLKSEMFRNNPQMIGEIMQAGIRIMMMSEAEEWDGKNSITHRQLHEVEIEDLMPREKIEVDMEAIGSMLCGKRVLITGAAGSIGSEMARQVAKCKPSELILIDQAETPMHNVRLYMASNHKEQTILTIVGSITNQKQMETIFGEHKPDYVFHAAAYKHVPMMEDNPAMAVQNNIYGTRVIADLAVKYGTKKFVMISTDKAVNPTNVMGCSKRICEIYCQALSTHQQTTQFVTTRFGNVLGSNGSVIPIFKDQIKKGGPVIVTHPDIIRYFMLIPEACRLVLEAGTMGKGGEIFVLDMGKPVRIVDLAKRMIQLSGAKNIEIKFSGLRDGEKLYEEVLNDAETTKPTVHPKIKVASVRKYPYDFVLQNEIDLYGISESFDDMAIVKKMKEIVPEYKSEVSKYQVLDQ